MWLKNCGLAALGVIGCVSATRAGPIVSIGESYIPPKGEFVALSNGANLYHMVGIRGDGSLAQWGAPELMVFQPPPGAFVGASVGYGFSIARRADGTLVGWGDGSKGQLNVPGGEFTAVSSGRDYSVALAIDGALHAWGKEGYPGPPIYGWLLKPPAGKYKAVAAGHYHGVAITDDGSLVGWGWHYGFVPNPAPPGPFVSVASGISANVVLRADGTIQVVGDENSPIFLEAPKTGKYISVSASIHTAAAVRDDGAIVVWGLTAAAFPAPESELLAVAIGGSQAAALAPEPLCPGDFNADTLLDMNDFIAFQTYFAIGDVLADCDEDGVLLIDDFLCFQTSYALGC